MFSELYQNVLFWIIEVLCCGFLGIFIYKIFTLRNSREEDKVKAQAFTDPLTKSGNRHLFLKVMDKLVEEQNKFAVCFMDLDGFKQINDTMGHDAGDELLIYLANTFKEKLPKNAVAYRLGGDEFGIIIQDIKTTEDITRILDDLKKAFNNSVKIENSVISLEYSLGVAIFPEDADNRQDLINYADDAMYYIKEHGKNNYYFHNKVLKAKLDNKNKMENDLKIAYSENQFGVYLQPRIDLKNPNKICFEAFLYWNHPVLGKIESEYFIKQADEMSLTIKLDQYMLDTVCKEIKLLENESFTNIQIAINISNRHCSRKDFVDQICNIISDNLVDKSCIQIGLTDNVELKKIENYKIMFDRLKSIGVETVINNLELRYEYLSLFSELDVDGFKISSKYLKSDNENEHEIFKDIIDIAKKMQYKVLVGNVETKSELLTCVKYDVNVVQGNYISKVIDISNIHDFIAKYNEFINNIQLV